MALLLYLIIVVALYLVDLREYKYLYHAYGYVTIVLSAKAIFFFFLIAFYGVLKGKRWFIECFLVLNTALLIVNVSTLFYVLPCFSFLRCVESYIYASGKLLYTIAVIVEFITVTHLYYLYKVKDVTSLVLTIPQLDEVL